MSENIKDVTCINYLIIAQPLLSPEGTAEEFSPVSHSWSVAELNLKPSNLACTGNNYVRGVQTPLGAQGGSCFKPDRTVAKKGFGILHR